jgi:hypothetical protein
MKVVRHGHRSERLPGRAAETKTRHGRENAWIIENAPPVHDANRNEIHNGSFIREPNWNSRRPCHSILFVGRAFCPPSFPNQSMPSFVVFIPSAARLPPFQFPRSVISERSEGSSPPPRKPQRRQGLAQFRPKKPPGVSLFSFPLAPSDIDLRMLRLTPVSEIVL